MGKNYVISLKDIDDKIDFHEKEISKLKGAKEIFEALGKSMATAPVKPKVNFTNKSVPTILGGTFKDIIYSIFKKEDKLFTTRRLSELYLEETGKSISYNTFSGQFSAMVKNNSDIFKNIAFNENPISSRFYYGLTEWFQGDNLKEEYKGKI